MYSIIHKLKHVFGLNEEYEMSWWEGDTLWVGFHCEGCGKITKQEPTIITKDEHD